MTNNKSTNTADEDQEFVDKFKFPVEIAIIFNILGNFNFINFVKTLFWKRQIKEERRVQTVCTL